MSMRRAKRRRIRTRRRRQRRKTRKAARKKMRPFVSPVGKTLPARRFSAATLRLTRRLAVLHLRPRPLHLLMPLPLHLHLPLHLPRLPPSNPSRPSTLCVPLCPAIPFASPTPLSRPSVRLQPQLCRTHVPPSHHPPFNFRVVARPPTPIQRPTATPPSRRLPADGSPPLLSPFSQTANKKKF
jgi:hypothetical protein